MKVVVCVKQTPSTTAVFTMRDGAVSWDDPGGKPNVVNPWDEYAVDESEPIPAEKAAAFIGPVPEYQPGEPPG